MVEHSGFPEQMNTRDKAADDLQMIGAVELGRAPATTRVQSKPERPVVM
jgi:hypothetical protein